LARKLGVRATPPINFDGIPNVSNQVTWFFRYAHTRNPTDIPTLWTLFERALDPAALESTDFAEAFDAALKATIIPSNLTIGLFWIRPNVFASLDGKVQKYLGINIEPKQLTANRYVAEVQHIAHGGISFPRLSYDAWRASRMPSAETVAATRKKVAGAYKDWLKEAYETQLSEMGSKKTREHLPAIAPNGAWADAGIQSKPLAWIVEFSKDANGAWAAGLPPSNYPKRIGGSFNSKSPLQGVLSRILPVVRTIESPHRTESHPYWEWALAFVFPGRPAFRTRGSSGGVIEFDPASGRLSSPVEGEEIVQPYVEAALFKLLPDEELWSKEIGLTYADATEALTRLINVDYASPLYSSDAEDRG